MCQFLQPTACQRLSRAGTAAALPAGHGSHGQSIWLLMGTLGVSLPALLREKGAEWRLFSKAMALYFSKKVFPILGLVTGTGGPLASQPAPCGKATVFGN